VRSFFADASKVWVEMTSIGTSHRFDFPEYSTQYYLKSNHLAWGMAVNVQGLRTGPTTSSSVLHPSTQHLPFPAPPGRAGWGEGRMARAGGPVLSAGPRSAPGIRDHEPPSSDLGPEPNPSFAGLAFAQFRRQYMSCETTCSDLPGVTM
jgi:hypothetical protein